MPEARLQRTRDAYRDGYLRRCGHQIQLLNRVRCEVQADGRTEMVREPQRFRVRKDERFCTECSQFVDAQDDFEAYGN